VARLVSGRGGADGAREPLGTASEEATRLADALQAWWTRRDDDRDADRDADRDDDRGDDRDHDRDDESRPEAHRPGHDAGAADHPAGTCRYCPLCRGLAVAQSLRPEVVQHLLDAAESVAAAFRELAAETGPGRPDPGPDRAERPHPRTVRIPVDDGDGGVDDGADDGVGNGVGDGEWGARDAAQDQVGKGH
jgi:hypothetical protein